MIWKGENPSSLFEHEEGKTLSSLLEKRELKRKEKLISLTRIVTILFIGLRPSLASEATVTSTSKRQPENQLKL